ncbi:MAG: hypothetical protein KIG52_05005, partial [Muribaculaceae bacterium]|nr:hypothetical protein [Muribaculaceae bacterium]
KSRIKIIGLYDKVICYKGIKNNGVIGVEDAKNGRVICTEYYDVTKRNETMKNNCRNVKVFICVNIL